VICYPRCELETELRRVGSSPLLAGSGLEIYEGLLLSSTLGQLLDEALSGSRRHDFLPGGCDFERVRGGTPARAIQSVAGGPVQDALFVSRALSTFVAQQVRAPIRPHGMRASYSIYAGEGAHLGIHRDVRGCDVALITCLHDSEPNAQGGAIDVWFDQAATPLNEVRDSCDVGYIRLALQPGQTMLMHGGVLPHRIPPLCGDRVRIVSLMCFEIVQ